MELKAYIKILRKNFLFIVVCVAVAATISYYAAHKAQNGYKLEQTYFISQTQIQPPADQQIQPSGYGNYYQQETARNFTDSAVSILQSPDFLSSYTQAPSSVAAQKIAPQIIKITITSPSISEAKFLLDRLIIGFNQNLKSWSSANSLELKAIGLAQEPAISALNSKVIVAAGAILGFALAVCVVAIKTYFKL